MTAPRRGGPERITPDEANAFLTRLPAGTLCIDDGESLHAAPARVVAVESDGTSTVVSISVSTAPGPDPGARGAVWVRPGPACFAENATEFPLGAGDSRRRRTSAGGLRRLGVYFDDLREYEHGWRITDRKRRNLGPGPLAMGTLPAGFAARVTGWGGSREA